MSYARTLARVLAEDVPDGRFGQAPPPPAAITPEQAARNRELLEAELSGRSVAQARDRIAAVLTAAAA